MPTVDIPDKICSHCGGIKVAAIAVGAYSAAIKAAQLQIIYKKLTGTPASMACLDS